MNKSVVRLAIEALNAEIARAPQALLLKERGRLHMMIGERVEAMNDLREAIRLDPSIVADLQNGAFEGEIKSCH